MGPSEMRGPSRVYQVSVLSVKSVVVKNGQVIKTEWGYAAGYPVVNEKLF